jgi:hypothetical protein
MRSLAKQKEAAISELLTPEQVEKHKEFRKEMGKKMMQKKAPKERAKIMIERLTNELELTETQQNQVEEVVLKRTETMEREKKKMKEQLELKHEESENETETAFEKILTPKQFEQFKVMKSQRPERKK